MAEEEESVEATLAAKALKDAFDEVKTTPGTEDDLPFAAAQPRPSTPVAPAKSKLVVVAKPAKAPAAAKPRKPRSPKHEVSSSSDDDSSSSDTDSSIDIGTDEEAKKQKKKEKKEKKRKEEEEWCRAQEEEKEEKEEKKEREKKRKGGDLPAPAESSLKSVKLEAKTDPGDNSASVSERVD